MVSSFENDKFLFDPLMGPKQVLPLQLRVDLGVIVMKGYSAFPKASWLEPCYLMQPSVISKILVGKGILLLCRDAVGVFYCPIRQCCFYDRTTCTDITFPTVDYYHLALRMRISVMNILSLEIVTYRLEDFLQRQNILFSLNQKIFSFRCMKLFSF